MRSRLIAKAMLVVSVCLAAWTSMAQQNAAVPAVIAASSTVPKLISIKGVLTDNGTSLSGVTGVTFLLYRDEHGGAPLWMETQNVTPGKNGQYAATLGATKAEGLPADLFTSGEARWLAVQPEGQAEQPRVLLVAVPYALKAGDAETVGGWPASAFVLAAPVSSAAGATGSPITSSGTPGVVPPPATITGTGTASLVPLFTGAATLGNSAIFQSGTSPTAKIGINTTSPVATLEVQGTGTFHGQLTQPSAGFATSAGGKKSYPLDLRASAFNSATGAAVAQNFLWQAEPVSNNTTSPSGTLNLLFGSGTSTPAETGLKIANNGQITFAPGQTFPGGSGTGTVTSVGLSAPGSDFTVSGSPVTASGTLGLHWKVAPTSANTANTIVRRDGTGGFAAGAIAASGTITAAAMGLGTATPTEKLDLGNGGNVVISTDPGNDTTPSDVAYNLVARGRGGVPYKWSLITAPVGGGFGVPSNSLSVYEYPSDQTNGCCLLRLAIEPSANYSPPIQPVYITGDGEVTARIFFGVGPTYGAIFSSSGTGYAGVLGDGTFGGGDGTDGGYFRGGAGSQYGGDGIAAVGGPGSVQGGYAGFFSGDVLVYGNVIKSGGSFKIDHPLDPGNKYLSHSFVESPDMMNIYNGNISTDAQGNAVVQLPEWFEALNRDFRYQLTVIGQFAQAIVASEIAGGRFSIKTDKPNVKVSWQVTGVRQDAWANAHRITVEETKPERERGFYTHPELFGAPEEKSISWAHRPAMMKQLKEEKQKPRDAAPGYPLAKSSESPR